MDMSKILPMTPLRKARYFSRKLWVRVSLFGMIAPVALLLSQFAEQFVPDAIAHIVGGSGADRLLNIIANAMLAVTTFSLSVMVSTYRAIASQFTPRVHRLIMHDPTTQNTLAVFIGAYVYALMGIILRETGFYVDEQSFVLFVVTVVVMVIVVISLIRWVLHLQSFGSLIDTTRQVEDVTRRNFLERLETPCLGAVPLTGDVPEDAKHIRACESGYIKHIYPEALQAAAEAHGVEVYLVRNIGSFVSINDTLARVRPRGTAVPDAQDYEDIEAAVEANVVLGDVRTYDQDPRFGLLVMGEIASKALSSGINDPGTAIDVITRVGRILSNYKDETEVDMEKKDRLDRLYVRPLDPVDLIEDGFGALSRDGKDVVEVQMRLQTTFASLMNHPDEGLSRVVREAAKVGLLRSLPALEFERDRERLCSAVSEKIVREAMAEMEETAENTRSAAS